MRRRHRPKIASGKPAPDWLLDHGDLGLHPMGPPEAKARQWEAVGLKLPDRAAIRRYRIERIRQELEANDCDGALLYDPLNIRYATDTTNMSIWTMHNQVRYVYIATDGPVIVFEYSKGEFLDTFSEVVDEIRPATSFIYFYAGNRITEIADRWASEIYELVAEHGRDSFRLAVDNLDIDGIRALERRGLKLFSAMPLMEEARSVKSSDEIDAMRCAVYACDQTMMTMRQRLKPGMSEIELWSILWDGTINNYGEWIETRLLSSGPRTNPWYQEASSRVMQAGELVAFDTDLIGPYGACVDVSRTWLVGDAKPNAKQQKTFELAKQQVSTNIELLQPGTDFRSFTEAAWYPPYEGYNSYTCLGHGVGLCDEYPTLYVRELWDRTGYDGHFVPGMVISVESFVGPRSGERPDGEGVKLEQQVLITDHGHEILDQYPLELT